MISRKRPSCPRGSTRRFSTREFSHQPGTASRLMYRKRSTSKPAISQELPQRFPFVASEVIQVHVERAIERRHRRHEQHQMSARRQDRSEVLQRRPVVFDVLEHVEAHDGVDSLAARDPRGPTGSAGTGTKRRGRRIGVRTCVVSSRRSAARYPRRRPDRDRRSSGSDCRRRSRPRERVAEIRVEAVVQPAVVGLRAAPSAGASLAPDVVFRRFPSRVSQDASRQPGTRP